MGFSYTHEMQVGDTPTDFYQSHLESHCPFPLLLLPLCSSLTTFGSSRDHHTLGCFSGLSQVYSLYHPVVSHLGGVGGVWDTGKVSPGTGVQPLVAGASWGGRLDENAVIS